MKKLGSVLSTVSAALMIAGCSSDPARAVAIESRAPASAKNIVIVHGAFADGSGWSEVSRILTARGYKVTIVQNPLTSLDADVAATQAALANQDGGKDSVVLVGHSYGGMVITQAGLDDKVKSLVYVAAYVPSAGESVGDLLGQADKSVAAPDIIIDQKKGIAFVDPAKFPEEFAADVDKKITKQMAKNQLPLGLAAVGAKITTVAWEHKPSYYIVSSKDRMIPPADERKFALKANAQKFEYEASHAIFMTSHAVDVANVIETAAKSSR